MLAGRYRHTVSGHHYQVSGCDNAMPGNHHPVPGSCDDMFGIARRHTMSDDIHRVSCCSNAMPGDADAVPRQRNTVSGSCDSMLDDWSRHAMPDDTHRVSCCGYAMPGDSYSLSNFGGDDMSDGGYTVSHCRHSLHVYVGICFLQRAGTDRCGGSIFSVKLGGPGGVCHC